MHQLRSPTVPTRTHLAGQPLGTTALCHCFLSDRKQWQPQLGAALWGGKCWLAAATTCSTAAMHAQGAGSLYRAENHHKLSAAHCDEGEFANHQFVFHKQAGPPHDLTQPYHQQQACAQRILQSPSVPVDLFRGVCGQVVAHCTNGL